MCHGKIVNYTACGHRALAPHYCHSASYMWSENDGYNVRIPCLNWRHPQRGALRVQTEHTNTRFCANCHAKLMRMLRSEEASQKGT